MGIDQPGARARRQAYQQQRAVARRKGRGHAQRHAQQPHPQTEAAPTLAFHHDRAQQCAQGHADHLHRDDPALLIERQVQLFGDQPHEDWLYTADDE